MKEEIPLSSELEVDHSIIVIMHVYDAGPRYLTVPWILNMKLS